MATKQHKKLLCIYPWLAMGGADKFNIDMVTELDRRGWEIVIITTLAHQHPWKAHFEPYVTQIMHIGQLAPAEQPAALLQIVEEQQPSHILISNSEFGYWMLPALRANYPQAAYIDYCHAIDTDHPNGGYPYLSVQQQQYLDCQIVTSMALRNWMIDLGGDATKIAVCTINIDTEYWNPAIYQRQQIREKLQIPNGALVGLHVARFERVKRPILTLRIMHRLIQSIPDAYFLIAGDGTYTPFIKGYIRANRLAKRIYLLGETPSAQIRDLLAASDLFLLPSRSEGIALSIYEAMAMGIVPISVAAGGQAELVTRECGVLIAHSAHDEQEYLQALLTLATDRKQLAGMGQAARTRVVDHFQLAQMGQKIDQLLTSAPISSVVITEATRNEAIAQAILAANRDARWAKATIQPKPTLRRHLVRIYWWIVAQGAWWLVPLVERLRNRKNN